MSNWLTRDPEDQSLSSPQLALVVCQVRHESQIAVSDPARALGIKEALPWVSELIETTQQQFNVVLGESAALSASQSTGARGWQLRSADEDWIVTLQPGQFALEARVYPGWKQYRERFDQVVSAVLRHVAPTLEHRLGLRFVNQIEHPGVDIAGGWGEFISDELFQQSLFADLGDRLNATLQVLDVRTPEGLNLVMRHGTQRLAASQRWMYVIDNDCSRQGSRAIKIESIGDSLESLHRLALQAFEMATTRRLRDFLDRPDS